MQHAWSQLKLTGYFLNCPINMGFQNTSDLNCYSKQGKLSFWCTLSLQGSKFITMNSVTLTTFCHHFKLHQRERMAERVWFVYQHVLFIQRCGQNIAQILCGPNDIRENRHQNKHCLQILLKCYENSRIIQTWWHVTESCSIGQFGK